MIQHSFTYHPAAPTMVRFRKLFVHCHQLESELLGYLIEYSGGDQEVIGLETLWIQPSQLLHQCSKLFVDLLYF